MPLSPKGTLCLRIADALAVYQDGQFAALFPSHGQPAAAPGQLALAVVLQFVENLSDREAADAVRGRIDWTYALGLALTDSGFDHTVLSEFRTRLVAGDAGLLLLDTLLQRLQDQGLVKARGRQRMDSTHVPAAVRTLNRLERVGGTMDAGAEWISSVPGSDTAPMLALVHTLVSEGLHDRGLLDRCTEGWPVFERYLLGAADGQPKDAAWAAPLAGVDADTIANLARSLHGRRALVTVAHSLQRAERGEQPVWTGAVVVGATGIVAASAKTGGRR